MISKDRQGNKESLKAICETRRAVSARASRRGGAAPPLGGAAGQRSDFARELELDQRHRDGVGREAGTLAKRVDAGRIVSERRQYTSRCAFDRDLGGPCGRGRDLARQRQSQLVEHVLRRLDELGSVLD